MKRSKKLPIRRQPPRLFVWLLLLLSMASHSLDACIAHNGVKSECVQAISLPHCEKPAAASADCALCRPADHEPHLCEIISEHSTTGASGFRLDIPQIIVAVPFALPADFFVLAPPSQAMRSRDGPDSVTLVSLCQRSTLPGRSPPFSA